MSQKFRAIFFSVLVVAHAMINSSAANGNEPKLEEPAQSPLSVREGHFVLKFSSTRDYVYQLHLAATSQRYRSIEDIFPHGALHSSLRRPAGHP
jgi:hypothetical protein